MEIKELIKLHENKLLVVKMIVGDDCLFCQSTGEDGILPYYKEYERGGKSINPDFFINLCKVCLQRFNLLTELIKERSEINNWNKQK